MEYVAAVGGKVLNLVAGDGLADFVCVRLNLERVGLNGDALSHGADLERNIDPDGVTHIQCDVLLLVCFEALGLYLDLVVSEGSSGAL